METVSACVPDGQQKCFKNLYKRAIGLDTLSRSCIKIRIKEIKKLQLCSVQDMDEPCELFTFMNHAVDKVEIIGIVVMVDRKERVHSFAVDDGTGVMLCVVWKTSRNVAEIPERHLPASLRKKCQDLHAYDQSKQERGYDIGDLVQVRGWVTTYRDEREIIVLDHRNINNPNVEMEAVLEIPSFYRVYKQMFVPPESVTDQLHAVSTDAFSKITVQNVITSYILDPGCSESIVTPTGILLLPSVMTLTSGSKNGNYKNDETCLDVIKVALQNLESTKGSVCKRVRPADTYEIIRAGCPMAVKVLDILRRACKAGKNAENGCHVLHLKTQLSWCPEYPRVPDQVLSYLLSCLEANSDVVCLNPQRYMATV